MDYTNMNTGGIAAHNKAYINESIIIPHEDARDTLYAYLSQGEVDKAKELFQDRDWEVNAAISEYEESLHIINNKPNKSRGNNKEPYITNKVALPYQKYINDIAVFFMLGKPVIWRNAGESDAEDEAFEAFKKVLYTTRNYVALREAKRLAGAETESAKIYHIYRDSNNTPKIKAIVISKSKGYTLRPLFDQYGDLIAFGYGFIAKSEDGNKTEEHLNIYTESTIFECIKASKDWQISSRVNPIGKIPVIYYRQPVEWDGVQHLIERIERVRSSEGDTNDYFSDPMLLLTAQVVSSLPDVNLSGRALQVDNPQNDAKYLEPPTSLEMKENEKRALDDSILRFTHTPDFSADNLKGMGTISGDALKRALTPAIIKRDNRLEIYEELLSREVNLILAIMRNVTHIGLSSQIDNLRVEFSFAEPFAEDAAALWASLGQAVSDKIMSRYTAIDKIGLADTTEELARITEESSNTDELNMFPTFGQEAEQEAEQDEEQEQEQVTI